jgi:SAM-dependent methyltransferase
MTGGFYSIAAIFAGESKLLEAFKTGTGVSWSDQCNCLFCGVERFYGPGYRGSLVAQWLPALDGMVAKLERGAKVADVGCGHALSTFLMAKAFPRSTFIGIDFHEASVAHARERGGEHVNVRFEQARAQDFAGSGYDLVTMFDALHDMGDPLGAARHVRQALKADGTLMLVEPMAGDSLADNLNPVGRIFYASSTAICVPTSLAQEVGAALGAQAGEKRMTEVLREAGFSRVRRATATPFNMVIEARP